MKQRALEVGAKTGDFVRQFLPHFDSYATDVVYHRTLDVVCDVLDGLSFDDAVFDEVWLVNPWKYGFDNRINADTTMMNVDRVLRSGGRAHIIGHTRNNHCRQDLVGESAAKYGYECSGPSAFDAATTFPGFVFRRSDGHPTTPNIRFVLVKP